MRRPEQDDFTTTVDGAEAHARWHADPREYGPEDDRPEPYEYADLEPEERWGL